MLGRVSLVKYSFLVGLEIRRFGCWVSHKLMATYHSLLHNCAVVERWSGLLTADLPESAVDIGQVLHVLGLVHQKRIRLIELEGLNVFGRRDIFKWILVKSRSWQNLCLPLGKRGQIVVMPLLLVIRLDLTFICNIPWKLIALLPYWIRWPDYFDLSNFFSWRYV